MAKTLVITGANYTVNKFDTVTLEDPVPCTGISLNESSKSLTSLTAFTLTATVTPADTTDVVEWTSSDETVATVVNGVVTPLSLGAVTITATCGEQSAACAVEIDNVVPDYVAVSGYNPFRRTSNGNAMTTDKKTGDTSSLIIVAANRATGLYPIESKTDVDTSPYRFVPILIPAGATKIVFNTATIPKFKTRTYFLDSTKEETTFGTGGAYCLYGTTNAYDQDSTQAGPITLTIPDDIEGLDSCCFCIAVSAAQTIYADLTEEISMVFTYDHDQ